jgi:SAM-dependent methyltransferase
MEINGKMTISVIREEILTTIASIIPYENTEREHLDFVKDWIASGAEIFRITKPDKPNIHLVVYFIVIDPQTNEFLLVDHKKAELWLPPGGHVEINEHPRETVKREIKEELGIDAEFMFEDPLFLTVTNTAGNVARHTDISLWYVLRGNREKYLKFDADEFYQIQWFHQKEIPYERTDPHMKRFVDKVMKKLVTLNSYEASAFLYAKNTTDLHPKEEAQKFVSRLPNGAKIIDIGCGPGRDAKVFSGFDLEVVGVDFSAKMIELAKQNASSCSFHVMDVEKLTFAPESFHGIWANCVLLHVPKQNIPSILDKMRIILKPKGVLYLSVKQSHIDESFRADDRYGGLEKYWSFYEPDDIVQLLDEAKFQIVDMEMANKRSDYHTHPIIKIFAEKQ